MKKPAHILAPLLLALSLIVGGCGEKHSTGDDHAGEGHGHEEGHEEGGGANFKEGAGVQLNDEAREAIGLETAEVSHRPSLSRGPPAWKRVPGPQGPPCVCQRHHPRRNG
jgi:hypothetical protein